MIKRNHKKNGKKRIWVPVALSYTNPELYELAIKAFNQEEANVYISMGIPKWTFEEDLPPPLPTKDDIQVAGSYSLDLCQGGSRYSDIEDRDNNKHKRRTKIQD